LEFYTAKQVTELLRTDNPEINLRTVRYYTQIGMIPPLELIGNKRAYTEVHVDYFRAILTLSHSGETLANIQATLKELTPEDVKKIGAQLHLYRSQQLLTNDTRVISEDVVLSMNPKLSAELRTKMTDTITRLLKEENGR
jgi:DNA-binding transcriptional MerR regulator